MEMVFSLDGNSFNEHKKLNRLVQDPIENTVWSFTSYVHLGRRMDWALKMHHSTYFKPAFGLRNELEIKLEVVDFENAISPLNWQDGF